jgi:hypothetical protein
MIAWVANALLGPVFRWFAYRCEVRLWMEQLDDACTFGEHMDAVYSACPCACQAPIPFELVND